MTLIDIFTNFALTCSHEGLITYLTANLNFQSAHPAKQDDLILMVIDVKYKKKNYALVECNFYTLNGIFVGRGQQIQSIRSS